MENKVDSKGNGGKIAIVGAIITAIAGIITTIVSVSAPLVDKRLAIQTTQTREAFLVAAASVGGAAIQRNDTPSPVFPTAEVIDSAQTEMPTLTLAPTITLAPASAGGSSTGGSQVVTIQPQASDTPSETFLRVGESWTGNGLSIQLKEVEFPAGDEVHLHFAFTNQTKKVINISMDHNRDISLTDDKGKVYNWATAFSWDVSIYPGTTRNDEVKRRGDVSRASYFIIKLEIPGLVSAQWKN